MKSEDFNNQIKPKLFTSKSRLKGKLYINKVTENKKVKKIAPGINGINSKIKSKNNVEKNLKDYLGDEEQSTGVQAYINTYSKLDKAYYVGSIPIKAAKAINKLRNTINAGRHADVLITEKDTKRVNVIRNTQKVIQAKISSNFRNVKITKPNNLNEKINFSSPKLKNAPSGKINKRYLLKAGGKRLLNNGFNISVSTKNRIVDNSRDENGSSGIQAFFSADKNIRRSIDAARSTKEVITGVAKASKYSYKTLKGSGNYIKERIAKNKNIKYQNIKSNILKSNRIKTGARKAEANNILMKNAKKEVAKKYIYNKRAIKTAKDIFNIVKNNLVSKIIILNPTMLIIIAFLFMIIIFTSASGSIVSAAGQNYFITDDGVAIKYKEKVDELDKELKLRISSLENDESCDDVDVIYIGDSQDINTNFQEIFSLAAVKFEQDLTFSNKEEKFIEDVYSQLYEVKVSVKKYTVTDSNGKKEKKKRKIITIYAYDMEKVMNKLNYDDEQKSWSRRLVSNFSEQFPEFAQQYGEISQEDISILIANAPKFSSSKQKYLYETTLSIVGKVKYFWGGKSAAGWNSNWGESRLVTSPGNDTTGTYIPYGLDCSGYVDWVYKTAGIGNMLSGGGTAYQWKQSYPVSRDELQVGDLAFMQMPNSSGINHVGIYIGRDKDGNNLYAHSEWGSGVTINGFKGFKYFRRVVRFE